MTFRQGSREYVARSGGSIELRRRPRGAAFAVTLRVAPETRPRNVDAA